MRNRELTCYCGARSPYIHCCQPAIEGSLHSTTAAALMRSRYSAFCLLNSDYLLHTWHPDTRPRTIQIDHSQQWTGLKVLHCEAGGINDEAGSVEFIARYKLAGKGYRLHETSRFVKLAAQWLYLDGQILEQ